MIKSGTNMPCTQIVDEIIIKNENNYKTIKEMCNMKKLFILLLLSVLVTTNAVSASDSKILNFDSKEINVVDVTNMREDSVIELKSETANSKGEVPTFYYRTSGFTDDENVVEFHFEYGGFNHIRHFIIDEVDEKTSINEISSIYIECKDILSDLDVFVKSLNVPELLVDSNKESLIEFEDNTKTSQAWILNDQVHSGEYRKTGHEELGKISYLTLFYEQIAGGHYFTRVESHIEFVPGDALDHIDDSYDPWFIDEGGTYSTTTVSKRSQCYYYYCNYSDEPRVIDYWPINDDVVNYTVSSAWGLSGNVGYSEEDGFEGGIAGDFSRSTSYTASSPRLRATAIEQTKSYNWTYLNHKDGDKHEDTQHHRPSLLVEQPNINSLKGFRVKLDLYMKVDRGWFYTEQEISKSVSFDFYGDLQ